MKAVLLSNGFSVKDYGHDIVNLFRAIKLKYPDLVISNFEKPKTHTRHWDYLSENHGGDFNAEKFCETIYSNGHANNRYAISGYVIYIEYLYMLDQLVFSIRRMICQIDEIFVDNTNPQVLVLTNRQHLKANPQYFGSLDTTLDKVVLSTEEKKGRTAVLNMNFPFAPPNFEHKNLNPIFDVINSPEYYIISEPLKSTNKGVVKQAIELGEWLLNNTYWNQEIRNGIEAKIQEAKTKHNLP